MIVLDKECLKLKGEVIHLKGTEFHIVHTKSNRVTVSMIGNTIGAFFTAEQLRIG